MPKTAAPDIHRDQRLKQLAALREAGVDPYPVRTGRSATNAALQAEHEALLPGEFAGVEATVAGRVLALRNSGMFIEVFDGTARIQVFNKLDAVSGASRLLLDNLALGDFIAATGPLRRTPRGALTVDAREMRMLAKALIPPPEKYHGLADVETRYRKRHLDIIGNAQSRQVLLARFTLIGEIRRVLVERGFLEVETPMLQPIFGGAAARPFSTHHNSLDLDLYLRIAPELYLKRLLVGGLSDKLFELNRNFRNEGISTRHNPEFTMLEVYEAYSDRDGMMTLVEDLARAAVVKVREAGWTVEGAPLIDFDKPFPRLSMIDAASAALGTDCRSGEAEIIRAALAARLGQPVEAREWGALIELAFEQFVEATLIEPTHVVDYPASISPLSKRVLDEPRIADRFETFAGGMEIANAFSELNDPLVQREVFEAQVADKADRETPGEVDEAFLEAIEAGMPPAGGMGMGIDRLAMLATGATSIREVIAFPLLRPSTGV